MDNVTHVLAGALLAEASIQLRARREARAPSERFARLAYVTSAIANNLPDLDMALTPLTGGTLGYLLHHRGHTHTLLVGVLMGALLGLAVRAVAKRRGGLKPVDLGWLLGLALLGPVAHVAMDGWNVYGVHPFWPVYDGWMFGDAVFILEPLLWVAALPALHFAATSRAWRYACVALTVGIVFLPWIFKAWVPLPMRVAVVLLSAGGWLLAERASPGRRIALGLGGFVAVALLFFGASRVAKGTFERELAATSPGFTTRDAIVSPLPANPLCFSGIAVQTSERGAYVLKRATVATAPGLFEAARCPQLASEGTALLTSPGVASSPAVRWDGTWRASVDRLRQLVRERCELAAAMRFYRAPFWVEGQDQLTLGDLRFDRSAGLDFAELQILLAEPGVCPKAVPSWTPPRSDVLGP